MASERTSHLTPIFSQPVWEGKRREKKDERERRNSRDRGSTFSLDFPVIDPSNPGKTRGKVNPYYKSYCGVSKTLGGRCLSPTWFSSCLRTIQMVDVFGAEVARCFIPPEWGRRL